MNFIEKVALHAQVVEELLRQAPNLEEAEASMSAKLRLAGIDYTPTELVGKKIMVMIVAEDDERTLTKVDDSSGVITGFGSIINIADFGPEMSGFPYECVKIYTDIHFGDSKGVSFFLGTERGFWEQNDPPFMGKFKIY